MWGDPEEALRLDASDSLSMLLFQVASPAHIPWNDSRWQELLQGCNVWVHVELRDDSEGVLHQACESMIKHAANSSNLAAFCRLVSQMLDDLSPSSGSQGQQQQQQTDQVAEFSERIAIVGKARAAAGSLQLLRVFVHRCLVHYCDQPAVLADIFTYRNRDSGKVDTKVGLDLLESLFHFVTSEKARSKIVGVPEMYDTAVLAMQLLVVMLSTQLYQPMLSSFQQAQQKQTEEASNKQSDFFLDLIIEEAKSRRQDPLALIINESAKGQNQSNGIGHKKDSQPHKAGSWTPKSIVSACLTWQIQRSKSPDRSIAHYHYTLAKSVAAAKGEKVGPDGMYESNLVVSAASTQKMNHRSSITEKLGDSSSGLTASNAHHHPHFLLDATKGVLVQASTIILLPFRLVSLALGLWNQNHGRFESSRKSHFSSSLLGSSRTRDVLWISESPLSDLATCLFLLLTNSRRADKELDAAKLNKDDKSGAEFPGGNPFRIELSALTDNRWDSGHDASALPDLPDPTQLQFQESMSLVDAFDREQERQPEGLQLVNHPGKDHYHMTLNFETLFLSFGSILHTEVGALAMYTLLRSSKVFSDTLAVRSDLDTLVLPLLRTLYFSSTSRHVSALDFQSKTKALSPEGTEHAVKSKTNASSIRTMPFRSQSQLYVIVILLLLFSQDSSFGSDAFRRTLISNVPWYKERYLKDVSLGSVLLLTLLRSITFNLNRLQDMFLLGNCCAVTMNLSSSVVDLHDYAAMRLAAVTVSCAKKYTSMHVEETTKNGGGDVQEGDANSLLDMYAEVSHTLLRLIKHTLAEKNIERNLGVVYALVYHQADFKKIFAMKHTPFKKSEISRIHSVIKTSSKIIESQSNARTAAKALQVLSENIDSIKEAVAEKKKKHKEKEDFAYTYEEESDPETFFVPYIWEVVVCAVTASSVEWDRNKIQVFPLLEIEEVPEDVANGSREGGAPAAFATDILDMV